MPTNKKINRKPNNTTDNRIEIKLEYLDLLEERLLTYSIDDIYTGKADKSVILMIIHVLATKINFNLPLSEKYKKYLTDALFNISEGTDPLKAFFLKKGSKWKNSKSMELRISLNVWYLLNIRKFSLDAACHYVGEMKHKDAGTIREIYYRNRPIIEEEYFKIEAEKASSKK